MKPYNPTAYITAFMKNIRNKTEAAGENEVHHTREKPTLPQPDMTDPHHYPGNAHTTLVLSQVKHTDRVIHNLQQTKHTQLDMLVTTLLCLSFIFAWDIKMAVNTFPDLVSITNMFVATTASLWL